MQSGGNILLVGRREALASAASCLGGGGYQVRSVADEVVETALAGSPWSLVLSGWSDAGVDAPAVCRKVRAHPSGASVPLVARPSLAHGDRPAEALGAGADDYVRTGCEPVELLTRVEAAVRARRTDRLESRLQALVANLPGAVYRCSPGSQWTMDYVSERIIDLTGYPPEDFIGDACRSFASVIHPDDREATETAVAVAVARGEPFVATYRVVTAAGETRWITDRGRLVADESGRERLDGVLLDVTAQHDAQQRLRDNLARQAASDERARLAADLHDSVSQSLFSMSLHARAAQIALARGGDEGALARSVGQLRSLSETALAEMRALIFELRPGGLEEQGLVSALRRHAADVAAREGLGITVDAPEAIGAEVDAAAEETLYRVVQEALHNVVKHARARTAAVTMVAADGVVDVAVADDGDGFDPDSEHPGHLGLVTMRERLARCGGQLQINSGPGGTTVRARIPSSCTGQPEDMARA